MDVFVFAPVVHTLVPSMKSPARFNLLAAGLLGFSGVALGAAGAHGKLHDALIAADTLDPWRTAVLYQLVHAVALLGFRDSPWVGRCWVAGIALFSGSLYWLALGGPKFIGPATPLGGVALLLGWGLLAWHAFRLPKA
jgi:uncharacterized membrane protein YgdD (TMEM256/DUF423 family)